MKHKENKGPYTFKVGSFYRCRAPRRKDVKALIDKIGDKVIWFTFEGVALNGRAKRRFRKNGDEYFIIDLGNHFRICESWEKRSINTKTIKTL